MKRQQDSYVTCVFDGGWNGVGWWYKVKIVVLRCMGQGLPVTNNNEKGS